MLDFNFLNQENWLVT